MKPQPQMKLSDRHSSAALLALTTAVLILVLAGVLFAAEVDGPAPRAAAPGATTVLTGWFHTQLRRRPQRGRRSHARPRARRRQRTRHAALRGRRRHRGGGRSRRDRSPPRHRRGPALLPAAVGERGGPPALLRAGDRARQEPPRHGDRESARRARARQRSPEVGVDPVPLRTIPPPSRRIRSRGSRRSCSAARPPASITTGASRRSPRSTSRGAWWSAGTRSPIRAPTTCTATPSPSTRSAPPPTARRPRTPTSTSRASSAST